MKHPAKIQLSSSPASSLARLLVRVLGVLLLVCVAAATTPAGKRKVSRFKALRLDPGTAIEIRLLSQIHSGEAQEGDTFEATLAKPLVVDGRTVLPKNTSAKGRVVEAVSSGRLKRPAALTLELVDAGGYSLRTEPVTLDGESHAGRNAALIGGGAAAGAIIGALTGGKKGAVIGAAIGAGAGTGTAYLTGKKELVLPVEFLIGFVTAGSATTARQLSAGETQVFVDHPKPRQPREKRVEGTVEEGTLRRTSPQAAVSSFSSFDRRTINSYLSTNRANLPPGLAKREKLPPGLERKLRRDGKLPPGLQKRLQPFPTGLAAQLPPLPTGFSRVFLGNRALLLDTARRIVDLFVTGR
jgi:hypothetical protein